MQKNTQLITYYLLKKYNKIKTYVIKSNCLWHLWSWYRLVRFITTWQMSINQEWWIVSQPFISRVWSEAHGVKSSWGLEWRRWEAVFLWPLTDTQACSSPILRVSEVFWPKMKVFVHIKIFFLSLNKIRWKGLSKIDKEYQTTLRIWKEEVERMAWGNETSVPLDHGRANLPHLTWATAGVVVICEPLGSFCWSSTATATYQFSS